LYVGEAALRIASRNLSDSIVALLTRPGERPGALRQVFQRIAGAPEGVRSAAIAEFLILAGLRKVRGRLGKALLRPGGIGNPRAPRHFVKLSLLLLATALAAIAQNEPETIFRSDTPLVELHATVFDKSGHLLTGLPQSAFQVFENGQPQQIKVFREEDARVSLGLIVDSSASMKPQRDRIAAALISLIRASNPGDEEFAIRFNQAPELLCGFTQKPEKIEAALANLDSGGETALRDALDLGLEYVKRSGKYDRKALVAVTDGADNSSVIALARLLRDAQESGVTVYAIGLPGDGGEREAARAHRDLDAVVNATGGEAFYPANADEVDGIARRVAHDLRNQYTIAYSPANASNDGSWRAIRVTVSDPAGSVVKTRSGYFARGVELPHCDAPSNSESEPVRPCGDNPPRGGDRQNPH
jgi:VWFA-related protein